MAGEHKGIALVILGIVAVIAIVGLVLLFTQTKGPTGEGVYGGALKKVAYPYWTGRGVPRNVPEIQNPNYVPGRTPYQDMQTHWNYWSDTNNRNPIGDVPSAMRKCETGGFLVPYDADQAGYYASLGYTVVQGGEKPGMCVYPQHTMIGGVAGFT
jgi:hypothetical protein